MYAAEISLEKVLYTTYYHIITFIRDLFPSEEKSLPEGTSCKNDVVLTSMRRDDRCSDVDMTSFWHKMLAGLMSKLSFGILP